MSDIRDPEEIELPEPPDDGVEPTEDGGALIPIGDAPAADDDGDHFANLAAGNLFTAAELAALGNELYELVDKDKQARQKRDKQYEEGLKRTGFGDDAPGGAQFNGASRVVHPLIGEAGVDYQARVMKEMWPPDGPVKDKIIGDQTAKKVERARRKTKWLNWQMTEQMKGCRSDFEQGFGQEPYGGAFYMQAVWDQQLKRPVQKVIFVDELILPYGASDYLSAQRRTYLERITDVTFKQRVASGMYVDIDEGEGTPSEPDALPQTTRTQDANEKIIGEQSSAYNEDGLRIVYMIFLQRDIEDEGEVRPYIVYVDEYTKEVLGIYRNWEPDDDTFAEIEHIVEFPFIPWRDGYIGLPQLIGGLSAAATGALRALMDSALLQVVPTLLKLKAPGTRGGQSIQLEPTEMKEVEGSLGTDDIRKTMMAIPFNPPSPVLFQLLGFLVDAGRGVVRTTLDEVADTNKDVPVGTMLVRQEEGMKVFSAIFGRQHAAMARFLRILHRLNKKHLTRDMVMEAVGEPMVMPEDFDSPDDIVPVSDPHIFSEAQRFAQMQAILQLAQLFPEVYNRRKVNERALDMMRVPAPEELLAKMPAPVRMNAINENLAATMGQPVVAFPDQEHLAHLQAHLDYMASPMFGMSQLFAPTVLPTLLTHVRDHLALWYVSFVVETVEQQTGVDVGEIMGKDEENNRKLDVLLAIVSTQVIAMAPEVLARIPPVIEQAMKVVQSLMPPMPQDPTAAAAQASMAETQRKKVADADKKEIEGAKIEKTAEEKAQERATKLADTQIREQAAAARNAEDNQTKILTNTEDNETALTIATMDNLVGNRSEVSTGTGTGSGPNP